MLLAGATKAAVPQLARSLQAELSGSPVGVHVVSPGMMLTELLLDKASPTNKAVVFNILAEQPEVRMGHSGHSGVHGGMMPVGVCASVHGASPAGILLACSEPSRWAGC